MTIDELIKILTNKITALNARKSDMLLLGDLDAATTIDNEIVETQATLDRLRSIT